MRSHSIFPRPRALTAATALLTLSVGAGAQTNRIPIRSVTAPLATTAEISFLRGIQEVAGGRVVIDEGDERRVALFDSTMNLIRVLADTTGSVQPYPRFGKLIRYRGDSLLFFEADSRSLVVIGPDGTFGRVIAPPKPQDANNLTSGGFVGTDARGRLVYQGPRPFRGPASCRAAGDPAPPPSPPLSDSVAIVRGDFDTRAVDTIGRSKIVAVMSDFPVSTYDANCKLLSAKVRVNPSVPQTDAWTVTSDGLVAIVRGHDYHIDWIDENGAVRSSPKMPYDWRRLTDADKKAKVDSAKHYIDSLTALGGYRLRACGRSSSFNTLPPTDDGGGRGAPIGTAIGGGGGGGGRASVASGSSVSDGPAPQPECQTITVSAEYAPLDSLADYIAPIRDRAALADRDGNVWILPTTSSGAKGGLLYDVVSPKGELVERVQLPGERAIEGFGKGGVLFLSHRVDGNMVVERVRIVRH